MPVLRQDSSAVAHWPSAVFWKVQPVPHAYLSYRVQSKAVHIRNEVGLAESTAVRLVPCLNESWLTTYGPESTLVTQLPTLVKGARNAM